MADGISAYPLCWPAGRGRTPLVSLRRSPFAVTLDRATADLLHELQLLGAVGVVISTNVVLRRDGLPRSDQREPADPGVAVYFKRGGRPFVIACDTYRLVRWNVRAIGATVEAMRTIQRHGSGEMLEQAFTGFAQLSAPRVAPASWWETLGVDCEASLALIRERYLALVQEHHPDRGGDHDRMAAINNAWESAQEARRG